MHLGVLPGTGGTQRLARVLGKSKSIQLMVEGSNMSVDELQQGNMRTWRKVYSYASIAKRLRATPISKGLFLAANFGYRFYGRRLDRFYTCDWQLLQPESTSTRTGQQAA